MNLLEDLEESFVDLVKLSIDFLFFYNKRRCCMLVL